MPEQKVKRKASRYPAHEPTSASTTATTQPQATPARRARTSSRPGRALIAIATSAITAASSATRTTRCLGLSSSGIAVERGAGAAAAGSVTPLRLRFLRGRRRSGRAEPAWAPPRRASPGRRLGPPVLGPITSEDRPTSGETSSPRHGDLGRVGIGVTLPPRAATRAAARRPRSGARCGVDRVHEPGVRSPVRLGSTRRPREAGEWRRRETCCRRR